MDPNASKHVTGPGANRLTDAHPTPTSGFARRAPDQAEFVAFRVAQHPQGGVASVEVLGDGGAQLKGPPGRREQVSNPMSRCIRTLLRLTSGTGWNTNSGVRVGGRRRAT
jgi:hypothetical protein